MELDERDPFAQAVVEWLNQPSFREERRYLETRLDLLIPAADDVLRLLQKQYQELPNFVEVLADHRDLLADILRRGKDKVAVDMAYVNAFGGVALDAPEWLLSIERQEALIIHDAPQHDNSSLSVVAHRVALWRDALTQSHLDETLQPEIHALILTNLWNALDDSGSHDASLQQELCDLLNAAMKIYTRERYTRQWATQQSNLGLTYFALVSGDRRAHQEEGLACHYRALEVRTHADLPYEWAMTQNNLSVAYSQRIASDPRLNQEEAITCARRALDVFTRSRYPIAWASVQNNLGTFFLHRLEGNESINTEQAITHFQAALEVLSADNSPHLYAQAQHNLASAYRQRHKGRHQDNLRAAENHLQQALAQYDPDHFPLRWASTQDALGDVYREVAAHSPNQDMDQAMTCFRQALRVFSRETTPIAWASCVVGFGLAWSDRREGQRASNLAKARSCFQAALRIYTADALPMMSRRIEINLAEAEATAGNWEMAYHAYQRALAIEAMHFAAGVDMPGQRAALKESREAGIRASYVLARIGRWAEAVTVLEQSRMRGLAQVYHLNLAHPATISDPSLREQYLTARTTFLQAQQALSIQVQRLDTADVDGPLLRDYIQQAHEAKARLTTLTQAVSPDHEDVVQPETILHMVRACGECHALVYLLATPWGVMAIGAFAGDSDTGSHFDALDLPDLTNAMIEDLADVSQDDDLSIVSGGFTWAQEFNGFKLLYEDYPDASLDDIYRMRQRLPHYALNAALAEIMELPSVHPWLKIPLNTLEPTQRQSVRLAIDQRFLQNELRRCLPVLAHHVMKPLSAWLRGKRVRSLTLVPCGALSNFPLFALSFTDGETLAEQFPGSVVPSARFLRQTPSPERSHRQGLYALGNPRRTAQRSLNWSDAEALTLAEFAQQSSALMPAHVAIQDQGTRDWLLNAMRHAVVLDIACHGEFRYQDPLQSRLLLAHNADIHLSEALIGTAQLRGLRLLVLSSCQSGIQDIREAREEAASLAVGFLQAGAQAVIGALWPVEDYPTFLLITRFAQEWFPFLDVIEPAIALARAQSWLRTVTFAQLQAWEARVTSLRLHQDISELSENLPVQERLILIRGQGYRASLGEIQETVQLTAEFRGKERRDDECPYADPIHWAAFQLFGR